MESKYYTHFVLTEFEGSSFGEFTGVVHVDKSRRAGMGAEDARQMLAQNFDVDINDLHIIQFSQLH